MINSNLAKSYSRQELRFEWSIGLRCNTPMMEAGTKPKPQSKMPEIGADRNNELG